MFDEKTKFGDRFLLRDGSLAVFLKYSETARVKFGEFAVFDTKINEYVGVRKFRADGYCYDQSPHWDIVKKIE